jgi:hypothetical protein
MLIRTPASWSPVLVAVLAMVALAALDLVGVIAAKEAVSQRSPVAAAVGLAAFVLLFWVYASSLQYAELAPVTFGWIVILQVGVLLVDHYRYGTRMPVGTWVAVVVIIAAQAYLLVGPGSTSTTAAQTQNSTVEKVPT